MNDCPVCGNNMRDGTTLLHHVWHQHMIDAPQGQGQWSPTQRCWCGYPTRYLSYWLAHMEGRDLQAHWLEYHLGIVGVGIMPF
jgi:hypothetical protein